MSERVVRGMKRWLAGGAAPTGLLLLLFFFMPWFSVECGPVDIAEVSGYQLARGQITVKDLSKMDDGGGGGMAAGKEKKDGAKDNPAKDLTERVKARPIYWLGLLLPLIIIGLGVLAFAGRLAVKPTAFGFLGAGLLGVVIMVMASGVKFEDDVERMMKEDAAKSSPKGGDDGGMAEGAMGGIASKLETTVTGTLWFALFLYLVVALLGIVMIVVKTPAAPPVSVAAGPPPAVGPPPGAAPTPDAQPPGGPAPPPAGV